MVDGFAHNRLWEMSQFALVLTILFGAGFAPGSVRDGRISADSASSCGDLLLLPSPVSEDFRGVGHASSLSLKIREFTASLSVSPASV